MAKITKNGNKLVVPDELTLPYIEGDGVGVEITNACKKIVEQPENRKEIEDAIMQVTGKKMYISIDEEKNVISKKEESNKLDGIDMPINIIEE